MSQNSQGNTCVGFSYYSFIKKGLQDRCFLVNFAKFLSNTFFTEHLWTMNVSINSTNTVHSKKKLPQVSCRATVLRNFGKQRHIRNSVKHLRWGFFRRLFNILHSAYNKMRISCLFLNASFL